jgi:hypothetical protein
MLAPPPPLNLPDFRSWRADREGRALPLSEMSTGPTPDTGIRRPRQAATMSEATKDTVNPIMSTARWAIGPRQSCNPESSR